jgi:hypothetical protein
MHHLTMICLRQRPGWGGNDKKIAYIVDRDVWRQFSQAVHVECMVQSRLVTAVVKVIDDSMVHLVSSKKLASLFHIDCTELVTGVKVICVWAPYSLRNYRGLLELTLLNLAGRLVPAMSYRRLSGSKFCHSCHSLSR